LLSTGVGPWITGGLVDTGQFDLQRASLMVTIEQLTMGTALVVLAGTVHRLPRLPLLFAGVAFVIVTQLSSYLFGGFAAMVVSRMFSGAGFAMIYSLSTALGASTQDPDRTFAWSQGLQQVAAFALNPLLGFGAELPGHRGVFAAMAGYCLFLGIPLLILTMDRNSAPNTRRLGVAPASFAAPAVTSPSPAAKSPAFSTEAIALHTQSTAFKKVFGVLALATLYSLATGAVWNFMERVAVSVGIGGTKLGTGLMGASLIAMLGSVLATRLGTTFGRVAPLSGGLLALVPATVWFMIPPSPWQFWMSVSLWALLVTFVTPYVFGLAAASDDTGRVVAATGSIYIIVSAAGAYVGACLVEHLGFRNFSFIAAFMLLVTAFVAALVARMVGASGPVVATPLAQTPLTPA
jgi:predicted MFS family arabinose efflux permease